MFLYYYDNFLFIFIYIFKSQLSTYPCPNNISFLYLHSNGASFTFMVLYLHICRSIIFQSYIFLFYTWMTGIFLYLFLLVIAFLGYVLPWGQMSFWGATVITNVLSAIPDLVEWICGSFFVYNPTLNRFFVLHFILPFLMMGFLLFH